MNFSASFASRGFSLNGPGNAILRPAGCVTMAPVKRWSAALLALALAQFAYAADDVKSAARELARRTAAYAGAGQTVSVAWRNVSSLGSAEVADARAAFEPAFEAAGGVLGDAAPAVEARITISENASQYLMAEEVRKGDERQAWFATWKRAAAGSIAAAGVVLSRKLVWEQDEQILDAAFPAQQMILLSPSKLIWFDRQGEQWTRSMSVPLPAAKSAPRDLRGRLRLVGSNYAAYLPGMTCTGARQPPVSVECKPAADPWVLESGSRDLLLANFAAGRNYFDGRIAAQSGLRKTIDPFYSAAAIEEQGRTWWVLAMVDGAARIFDPAFSAAGDFGGWGSDIVGVDVDARCGGSIVLATRAGSGAADAIQAYAVSSRAAAPVGEAAEFRGPVTALWLSDHASALAVSKDQVTGKYAAYLLTVSCGL